MTPDDERRIEDLEVKCAFLEHQLSELDGLVRELFASNAELHRQIGELRDTRAAAEESSLTFGAGPEKPPHY